MRELIPALGPSAVTDVGNAQRLAYYHGDEMCYVPAHSAWAVWDGRRWRMDDLRLAEGRAQNTARGIYAEAAAAESKDERKALFKWAQASESASRLRSLLQCAEPMLAVRPDRFDADPWLLNTATGTLDLRDAMLRPHARDQYLTKIAPVAWNPAAACPRWERFLCEITGNRPDLIGFLQRAWGSTLSGASLRDQSALLCYGAGANGKTVMVGVMRAALGDYATEADFSTFVEQPAGKPRPDLARLAGARLVYAEENKEGERLSEAVIKNVTGGGKVVARFLYGREFEYTPTFKLWLATNHKPVIRATDHGMWRRIHLVPFDERFEGPREEKGLEETLIATELPGVLAWAVAGCLLWQREGLAPAATVREATAQYRSESDTVGLFLEDCCLVDRQAEAESGPLYQAFRGWAEEQGERAMTATMFGRRLTERGIGLASRRLAGRPVRVRMGLRLLPVGVAQSDSWRSHRGNGDYA